MPIYEYRCGSCGAERELILKPGEQPRPACPRCRKRMNRVISPTAFILKGSGWYVTDYPSQERKKGLDADKAPAKEPAGGGDKAAEKKEAKAPAAPAATPAKKEGGGRKPRRGKEG